MAEVKIENRTIGDWVLRVRIPPGPGPHPVIAMIHGLSGNEDVMWVFSSRLPENALLIAPRALHPAPGGGYSWHPKIGRKWPDLKDLEPAMNALLELLSPANFPEGDFSQIDLVGFSQGAALCYALTIGHPEKVRRLAVLAGFLPEGADEAVLRGSETGRRPLEGKPVFITHGTRDERIPVEKARRAAELFDEAGAKVTYCEDDVGHKLSANCFRALQSFFQQPIR